MGYIVSLNKEYIITRVYIGMD